MMIRVQININSHADLAYGLNSTFIGNLVRDNECQLELNTPGFQQMASAYSSSSSSASTSAPTGATASPQFALDADSLALQHALIAYTEPTCYGLGVYTSNRIYCTHSSTLSHSKNMYEYMYSYFLSVLILAYSFDNIFTRSTCM